MKSSSGIAYRPELDILRFLAFLGVFVTHTANMRNASHVGSYLSSSWTAVAAAATNGGGFAVDAFFTLSGFLITTILLNERARFGKIDIAGFYLRRILRIWPIYFLALGIFAYVPLFDPNQELGPGDVLALLLFAGNWAFTFFGWPHSAAVPLWSISVEEQFYLLWPPIVSRMSKRAVAWSACACVGVAYVTRVVCLMLGSTTGQIWGNTFAHIDSIAAGILIAVVLDGTALRLRRSARAALLVSGVSSYVLLGMYSGRGEDPLTPVEALFAYPLETLGSAAILLAFLDAGIRSAALEYLGRISYGLYVYHFGCFLVVDALLPARVGGAMTYVVIRLLLSLGLSITIAALSYRYIERPMVSLGRRTLSPPVRRLVTS